MGCPEQLLWPDPCSHAILEFALPHQAGKPSPVHHSATTKTSAPDNSYSLDAAQTSQNVGLSGYKANGDRPFQVASSDKTRENGHKLSTLIRKKLFYCMGDQTREQIALEVLSLSLELFNTQLCMVLSSLAWVTLLWAGGWTSHECPTVWLTWAVLSKEELSWATYNI